MINETSESTDGSIWLTGDGDGSVYVLDQRYLPFKKVVFRIGSLEDAYFAIREMVVRGAPLIGVTAAFGMALAMKRRDTGTPGEMKKAAEYLNSSRPTAINLSRATRRMLEIFDPGKTPAGNREDLFREAVRIREEEILSCRRIGEFGLPLIEEVWERKKPDPVQVLTHCNAGWLACVKYGTATAPVYLAHEKGIRLHVWVDETRPRNQGARLTAYELGLAGVPHTVIPDNSGGYLMQQGMVDLVIVGSDRTTLRGDVANKTGTYLKALAAIDNGIPFYVALPFTSVDPELEDGIRTIPVEKRSEDEVATIEGWNGSELVTVRLIPESSRALNFGFDITPARLVTGLITDRGICPATAEGIGRLFNLPLV